jgi:hypothetical protein
VSKGIELDTLMTPSEILVELGVAEERIVVLSGPSFAAEVAADQPSAVVAAGEDRDAVQRIRDLFSTGSFRVYSSRDTVSTELGGALKNVIAIAVGISDGVGFGRNTRAEGARFSHPSDRGWSRATRSRRASGSLVGSRFSVRVVSSDSHGGKAPCRHESEENHDRRSMDRRQRVQSRAPAVYARQRR